MISGHVLFTSDDGQTLILDTGAPNSIARDAISIAGIAHPVQNEFMGISAEYLSEQIDHKVDGLLGADIIQNFTLMIDPSSQRLTFSEDGQNMSINLPIEVFMGIPILTVSVAGRDLRVFVDTGAKLSYIAPELTETMTPIGEKEDFYGGM